MQILEPIRKQPEDFRLSIVNKKKTHEQSGGYYAGMWFCKNNSYC